jgi:cysteine-rich repeat protein
VVRFRIEVDLQDGNALAFPENLADPEYEFYAGQVEELYCTDFETDPFADGWTHGAVGGASESETDDWVWGVPMSPASSNDPVAAFSGENVIGNDLGGELDGLYSANVDTFVASPMIDVGVFSDVRVHYRRWLTVEDAFYDQATITANGREAWTNLNSDMGEQSSTHHLDREWRFQDVPVSDFITDGKLQVRFGLDTDAGLQFGGWTIDDFCIVATPGVVCGDGTRTGAETCDDGEANSNTEPDACRTSCREAACGDGVVDSGEACDDGNVEDGDDCSADCSEGTATKADCGCDVTPRTPMPAGGLVLLMLTGLFLLGPRAARHLRGRLQR